MMSSLSHRATLAALIIITLTVALAWPVEAQPTPADLKSVLVRGEGVVVTTPDIATLNIGAAVRRETPAEASGRAEALAEALMRLLLDHGVERRDIQTTSVSLQPQFATRAPGESEQRIVAWRASRAFAVKLRDFSQIPAVLEQAAALLGDDAQIQGISFGIEDRDALITRARAEAFANAKRAADELAQLAGAQLGEVISIEEQFVPSPTPVQAAPQPTATPRPAPASAESAGAGGAEQIAPGQIAVRVTLVVRFALERPPPM